MDKKSSGVRKRIPIRKRFLQTVLLTLIISVLAASITGLLCIRWNRDAMEQTLMEQMEINLKNVIQEKAGSVDAKLKHYEKYIELIDDTVKELYAEKEEMISEGKMIDPPEDTREYALTRAFASEGLTEKILRDDIRLFSHLESVWRPILLENEDLITTAYLGTKDGLLVSYDRYSYLSVPQKGQDLIYNYIFSEWYRKGMEKDGVFYTGVYMDSQGRGLTMTVASAVHDDQGNAVGVTGMDFDLSTFYEELFTIDRDDGTFTFALDHLGTIISTDSDTLDLQEYTGLTLDDLDELRADPDGIMEKYDSVYVCVPMKNVDWTLCARVPREAIQKNIHDADLSIRKAVIIFGIIVVAILILSVIAINRSVKTILHPLELLGQDMKVISDGNLEHRAPVYRNDEIGDITSGMNEMVDRLKFTMNELISSQHYADSMSKLANMDSLTGMKNKTAFDRALKALEEKLEKGKREFGFVMLDLNNLKILNDNYGHDKGDITIQLLCKIACSVFSRSPVFRVGGDEFVVILQNEDYHDIEQLEKRFRNRIQSAMENWSAHPWERVSAAIGYALYDETLDEGMESVLARADKNMYICKKEMKEKQPGRRR